MEIVLKALDDPQRPGRLGSKGKGLAGGGVLSLRQGRDASIVAFPERAPAPEPWSEAGEARLRSALALIPADDRDVWLKVGFALHDLPAADPRWPGRALWDDWSKTHPKKFDPAGQDKAWASFGRDYDGERITVATIYHLAKEHGWRDPSAATTDSHKGGANSDKVKVAALEDLQEPQATFTRLAKLSPVDYDRARAAEAEKLGVRVGTLDEEVLRYRPQNDDTRAAGRALSLVIT